MSSLCHVWPSTGTWVKPWNYGLNIRVVSVSPPTEEPLELDYVRDKVLRVVNGTIEDEYIAQLIQTAREIAEYDTSMAIAEQTLQLVLDGFPVTEIELPSPPLISVESIEYLDAAGATQTFTASPLPYVVIPSGPRIPAKIRLATGQSWPTVITGYGNAVTVTFVAGYATPDQVPATIKSGMCLLITELYNQRQLSVQGTSVTPAVLDTSRFFKRVY